MEELIRQVVAALEEIQRLDTVQREALSRSRARSEELYERLQNQLGGKRDSRERTEVIAGAISERRPGSSEVGGASNQARSLEIQVFRMLRDLSWDEEARSGANRIWDLMEERRRTDIPGAEEEFTLPPIPNLDPAEIADRPAALSRASLFQAAMHEQVQGQMRKYEAMISRQDELLSQALAEARAMLG